MTEVDVINKKNEKARKELESAYKKTFATAHGKLVLADLRFTIPEPVANEDPYRLYYEMGRRNVMLIIEERLKERKDGI